MPFIYSTKCTKCDFETSEAGEWYIYVLDEHGNEIPCGHLLESYTIAKVLNISRDDAMSLVYRQLDSLLDRQLAEATKREVEDRVGVKQHYVCLDCFTEVFLDKTREEYRCASCGSVNLKLCQDLVNNPCPKCNEGIVEQGDLIIS